MTKQFLQLMILFALFTSCGSPQKALDSGDYEKAITNSVLKLKKDKNNTKQAQILQQAYNKATENDLNAIKLLKKDIANQPQNWTKIYNIYDRMSIREITIIPVMPVYANGRELILNVPNITNEMEDAKAEASNQLYKKGINDLQKGDRLAAREAYKTFNQLVEFNFNYRDAKEKREEAKMKGSVNVFVKMINKTGKQLPSTFENDLLTFREGAFSDPWILYSTKRDSKIPYNYEVDLEINQIITGRYTEQQRQHRETARVIVGYQNRQDENGNTVKVPQYADVYADVLETLQMKPIRVAGRVIYKEHTSQKVLAEIPVEREEAWQNIFAQFRGDQRALKKETVAKIKNGKKEVPTDKQFYEASGKLLNQLVVKLFEENAKNLK